MSKRHCVFANVGPIEQMGLNKDEAHITHPDFARIVHSRVAVQALSDLGIDVIALVETADHIFDNSATGDILGAFRGFPLFFMSFSTLLMVFRGQ